MILLLKLKQMFLKCFYDKTIKVFSLNIIFRDLTPGCDFLCYQSFWDKTYQEINFRSHLITVLLCK